MLFNSLHFLIFFPIVTITYYLLPHKYRWILLLISSYYFYMVWRPIYIVLIIISTIIDYLVSIFIYKTHKKTTKKALLLVSLLTNLGILFLFKYLGFFTEFINLFRQENFDVIYLILPMGISFYTFQTLSYTIDVFRGQRKPEYHLGYFALYVTFFPQLVAGPIERSDRLIPQFKNKITFTPTNLEEGLYRMSWGFFKKVLIADNLAIAVNHVYGNIEFMSGFSILFATVFFAYQIYLDFSGYSDIAIGAAKILGIDLMENFKRPYLSTSLRDFWSRWHISLTSWFKDYVYIPLGGSKRGRSRTYINILIVFLISGLWHGASFMFIIWGSIHGIYQLYERLTEKTRQKIWQFIRLDGTLVQTFVKWSITMLVVGVAWVFFRANGLYEISIIFDKISYDLMNNFTFSSLYNGLTSTRIDRYRFIVIVFAIIILEIVQFLEEKNIEWPVKLRPVFYSLIIWATVMFGSFGLNEFIYFQF